MRGDSDVSYLSPPSLLKKMALLIMKGYLDVVRLGDERSHERRPEPFRHVMCRPLN
jgi:hypothetical protein